MASARIARVISDTLPAAVGPDLYSLDHRIRCDLCKRVYLIERDRETYDLWIRPDHDPRCPRHPSRRPTPRQTPTPSEEPTP